MDHIVLPEKSELSQKAGEPEEVLNSLLNAAHLAPSAFLRIGSHFMKFDWIRKAGLTFSSKQRNENKRNATSPSESSS